MNDKEFYTSLNKAIQHYYPTGFIVTTQIKKEETVLTIENNTVFNLLTREAIQQRKQIPFHLHLKNYLFIGVCVVQVLGDVFLEITKNLFKK